MQAPSYVTVADIAAVLGVSERTVRRLIGRGELAGTRVGGQWRVPRAVYDQLRQPSAA